MNGCCVSLIRLIDCFCVSGEFVGIVVIGMVCLIISVCVFVGGFVVELKNLKFKLFDFSIFSCFVEWCLKR